MKKLMLGLVLVAVVAGCFVQPADAGRRMVLGPALKWIKAPTTTTAFNYDSTRVSIIWGGLAAADNVTNCDTTNVFDMAGYTVPFMSTVAADSTALVSFLVRSYEADGITSATTGDTSHVAIQFSIDGQAWTTMNASTGCWIKIGHASNTLVKAYARLNRSAAADDGARFLRALVANVGASAGSSLVRYYEVYPVYWMEVGDQ
jgi:hypothetical protein